MNRGGAGEFPSPGGPLGLYVHIPFCVRKCHYCDFNSGPLSERARAAYLEALSEEVRNSPWRGSAAATLFLGGGTPSELTLGELEALMNPLREAFSMGTCRERTIECNPGTLEGRELESIRALGFNRVSLGVQSLDDRHLATLGRIHDARQSLDSYRSLRRAGFDNINVDLIFGIPGQTLREWRSDLIAVLSLEPEHLSLYHLTIEAGTEFGNRLARGEMSPVDQDLGAEMYEMAMDLTRQAGFRQYEISNFCKPGRESRHNLIYWSNRPYLGFGISAASFIGGVRWTNTGRINDYCRTASTGSPERASQEQLPAREALGEEVMLRLRTRDGFSLSDLSRRYALDVLSIYRDALESFSRKRLLHWSGDRVRLTRRGKLVANEICQELL